MNEVFRDPKRPIEERITDLLGKLTLEEKISQMVYNSSAIPRLNIPEYNWWNECLHGVGRAGVATVFPQAIGMAASFMPPWSKKQLRLYLTKHAENTTNMPAKGIVLSIRDLHFGLLTSISSGIQGGAGGKKPMAKTPISPLNSE